MKPEMGKNETLTFPSEQKFSNFLEAKYFDMTITKLDAGCSYQINDLYVG